MTWVETNYRGHLRSSCGRWEAIPDVGGKGVWAVELNGKNVRLGMGNTVEEAFMDWAARNMAFGQEILKLAEEAQKIAEREEPLPEDGQDVLDAKELLF